MLGVPLLWGLLQVRGPVTKAPDKRDPHLKLQLNQSLTFDRSIHFLEVCLSNALNIPLGFYVNKTRT